MKGFLALLPLLWTQAQAAERGLPRGEERPAVIEQLYTSPQGEVQFTKVGSGHSGFLRDARGYLIGFLEVRGPAACEHWFLSEKTEALPGGCEFVFLDEDGGRELGVRSDEMREADIFQATRGKLRDWRSYVAL